MPDVTSEKDIKNCPTGVWGCLPGDLMEMRQSDILQWQTEASDIVGFVLLLAFLYIKQSSNTYLIIYF